MNLFERSHHIWPTLPCRGRVGLPKAVRGGVTATQYVLKRCHPLPARWRGPTSLQPNLAIARVRPLNKVTEVGNSRLRLGEVVDSRPNSIALRTRRGANSQPTLDHENNSDLITTGTTPGGEINSPTSTKSSSASSTPSIETRSPAKPSSSVRIRPMVLPISPSIISSNG